MDPWLKEPMIRRSLVALICRADQTLHMPVSAVKIASGAARFTERRGHRLRVHGRASSHVVNVHIHFSKLLFVFADCGIEKFPVRLCIQHRQKRLQRLAHIAPNSEIDFAAPSQILNPDVNLRDLALCRQEFVVRKISAQEKQKIAFVDRLVSHPETDHAGHSHRHKDCHTRRTAFLGRYARPELSLSPQERLPHRGRSRIRCRRRAQLSCWS